MSKSKNTKRSFSFRSLLVFLTFILVAIVIYKNWGDIETTFLHIQEANLLVLILLIPEQLLMLYAGGKVLFSYLEHKGLKKRKYPRAWTMMRIALESNFTKQAFPSAGISAAAYLSWRLVPYGSSPAQTSFMYILRQVIIVGVNQIQTLIATFFVVATTDLTAAGRVVVFLSFLVALGTGLLMGAIFVFKTSKRRIDWFADRGTRFVNFVVRIFTFGKKRKVVDEKKVGGFLLELHENYLFAKENKVALKKPVIWGAIYSVCEIMTYFIVGCSLGHPEILPQIMIGEAIGSVLGVVVPYGIYELGMAGAMASLGVNVGVASLVVVITRVLVLGETMTLGFLLYHRAIRRNG